MAKIDLAGAAPQSLQLYEALELTAIGAPARRYVESVYAETTLPPTVMEAARIRIAKVNGCLLCLGARRPGIDEAFYEHIEQWATWPGYGPADRLAAEFAERFALDHEAIDDDLWRRLADVFSREEVIDLGLSVSEWLGIGRFTQVFGLDRECPVVLHPATA